MANASDVSEILKMLLVAYPDRFKLGDSDEDRELVINTWYAFMKDIPGDLLKASVARFISTAPHNFPPTISEIRQQAAEITRQARKIPTPEEAWGLVRKQMVEVGSYSTPHFDYPILAQVVSRFGWRNLCLSENEVADRAHFMRAYESALKEDQITLRQLPIVTEYIEGEKKLLEADRNNPMDEERRAAFDTGERIHFLTDHLKGGDRA